MTQRTLEELEAARQRMQHDINRSKNLDPGALTRNSPLLRNFEQVNKEIAEVKSKLTEGVLGAPEKIEEDTKIKIGSLDHMSHALHAHHSGATSFGATAEHPNYHFHHVRMDNPSEYPTHHYAVIHKQPNEKGEREVHHISLKQIPVKSAGKDKLITGHQYAYSAKHHGRVM